MCLAAPAFDRDSVVSGVRSEVRAFYFVEKHSYLFDEYIRAIDVQLQQPVHAFLPVPGTRVVL